MEDRELLAAARAKVDELVRLKRELNTLKWAGADEGWERAIDAVCTYLDGRMAEIAAAAIGKEMK